MKHWRVLFTWLALVLPVAVGAQTSTFFHSPAAISMAFSATEPSAEVLRLHPFSKDYLKSFA